ncbi:MAG TPA: pyridoxal-phosphate dependent enzyme [Fimbriimonadaceae bacterium]|nr:pyridoxal-phosphate dependent enzyme [Fimbriimonadaceae bacterium]
MPISLADVQEAAARLRGVANETPILTLRTLDERLGARVFLKAEIFQRVGAFKFRGAYNAIAKLSEVERNRGIVAVSSGNHAQAVALASKLLGVRSTVLMPIDAPEMKVAATAGYGAEIVRFDRYKEDRDVLQRALSEERGAVTIPPYDHPDVMAGGGTVALELLAAVPDLDVLVVPVSGGGLIAGCATAAKAIKPNISVLGAEPETGNDTQQSLAAGKRIRIPVPATIADGLQVAIPGELTFEINRRLLDGVVTASDATVVSTMRFLFERLKIVVEPSGAMALAAIFADPSPFAGKRVGVVLSGGNVDSQRFCELRSGQSDSS